MVASTFLSHTNLVQQKVSKNDMQKDLYWVSRCTSSGDYRYKDKATLPMWGSREHDCLVLLR